MSLTSGSYYIQSDGTVKVCGQNNYGQLGLGDTTDRSTPTLISGLSNVKQISCGLTHTVFLLNDGTVKVCGYNNGQLGLGDTIVRNTPALISGLTNVKQAACGNSHTILLLNDGTVKVCGYNVNGQLGLGDTVSRITPTLNGNISNVKQISCGYNHTAFLLNDNTVKVCGYNNYGQLGLGDTVSRNTPILISGLIASILIDIRLFIIIKLLIQDNTQIKSADNGIINYTDVLPYTIDKFNSYGMDNLSNINNSIIQLLNSSKYKIALSKKLE